ncbi:transporter [Variovorax robiniae]|uniref:Transporter n=1 Tax=Variovorax robiniae TaxID=1836199 RepID=A0ABU8XIH1_9BURK
MEACTRWGCALLAVLSATSAHADEGGAGFWIPGQFGALAAVPSDAGWSLPLLYLHNSVEQDASRLALRGGRLVAGVKARADSVLAFPTYTFESPVLGGQAAFGLGAGPGVMDVSASATFNAPGRPPIFGKRSDSVSGGSDLYGQGTLKWNEGVNNYLVYGMFGAPVGAYRTDRLANLSLNHWSVDAGAGYTYFDKKNEFSAVLGSTYNFKNSDTQYRNGVDGHLDWSASRFFTPQTHAGFVGYYYRQLSGDSGSGAVFGSYKSSVTGLGLQVGHFFPVGRATWYVNVKAYDEFSAKNRPAGWNFWISLLVPLTVPSR